MNKNFWKAKKVLITGHTGFKGSWLSVWLNGMAANVTGYSLPPPTKPSLFEIAHLSEDMTSINGDVRDLEHLKSVVKDYQPEIVIHMASQTLVRYSYDNPLETYSTNIMGAVNLFEAIRQVESVRVVIMVTSDKCYENKDWRWGYRENDPMGGHDPYSSSKGCVELITSAYRHSFFSEEDFENHGVAVASVRAGNVIGGGDWAKDRLIPDIMKAFMENRPVIIRYPHAVRPWQHVLEPLNGYLTLAEKLWEDGTKFARAWNFGPSGDDTRPVSWIVDYLTHLWGDGASWTLDTATNPHEDNYIKLDCSEARSLLGWLPRLDLPTTLDWIVKWYRGFQQGKDMRQLTQREITLFEDEQPVTLQSEGS